MYCHDIQLITYHDNIVWYGNL